MYHDEQYVKKLVEEVIKKFNLTQPTSYTTSSHLPTGIFPTVDDAIKAALLAFREYKKISLQKRYEIINTIREVAIKNAEIMAKEAHEETKMGRVADKIKKNLLSAQKTPGPEFLHPVALTGDHGLTLNERAPYGIIASITPSTNPIATIINNSITMLSAGNVVVFSFHPNAKKCCAKMVGLINDAIISIGGPKNLITGIENPTMESSVELMKHPDVKLVCVTGGPNVVKVAFTSGKKVIAAGPGNPPVVVDETANIEKAAIDIVNGASFDNNVMCIAEKECIAVNSIFDKLKEYMKKHGAFELKGDEINRLLKVVFDSEGKLVRKWCGKDAKVILNEIGIHVSDEIRLIIAEVDKHHPFVLEEMLMPVLPLVRANNVDEAIDIAVWAEHGYGHTAIMHSHNIENLHKMASLINTTIFVKNGPSYAGLGFNGEGYTSLTIAGPTGEGVTTPLTFTRERRCVLVDYFRIV